MYQKKRLYLLASGLLGLGLALMSLEVGAQDGLTLERAVSLAYERNPEFSLRGRRSASQAVCAAKLGLSRTRN